MVNIKTSQIWKRPDHWIDVVLPEDDGDPRLLEACWALLDVTALPPAANESLYGCDIPVLDSDPDLNDLADDHTQGTTDDFITKVGLVRLAKAVLVVADRHATKTKIE